jgi:hypothetical protein
MVSPRIHFTTGAKEFQVYFFRASLRNTLETPVDSGLSHFTTGAKEFQVYFFRASLRNTLETPVDSGLSHGGPPAPD